MGNEAEMLLNAHIHDVVDSDTHFLIDETRTVQNASDVKTMLVQHDHNSERFTFEVPRYVDGHDMSLCDTVQIHYLNIDAKTGSTNPGVYNVDDLQVCQEDAEKVSCSWLVSGNATRYSGSLNFVVRFACSSDGDVGYVWQTAVYAGITVVPGIYNGDAIVEKYADILTQWEERLFSQLAEQATTAGNAAASANAAAIRADAAAAGANAAKENANTAAAESNSAAATAKEKATAAENAAASANTAAGRAETAAAGANTAKENADTAAEAANTAAAAAQDVVDSIVSEVNQLKDDKLDNTPETWPIWTEDQQSQARENIGAVSADDVYELENEIAKRNVFVTPEMFGAVGDGETDDTAAIQAAINASDKIVFGNKTYLVNKVQFDKSVELVGGTDTVIRTQARRHAFYCASDRPKATLTMTEDYQYGIDSENCCANRIAVSDTTSVEIGDVLKIYSGQVFNPSRGYYYKGAPVIVTDVDRENNLVYIGFVMPFDITADGAYVQVFRGSTLRVRNIRFQSTLYDEDSGSSFGFYMKGCANSQIENCTFEGFTHNLYLDCCVNTKIRSCRFEHAKRERTLGWDGYGIVIGSCNNTLIEHVTCRSGQSAVSTGGANPVVPVYNTHIVDCALFSECSGRAVGCHENNYDITIDSSVVAGAWVTGNVCIRNTRFVQNAENSAGVLITGNDGTIDNIVSFDHVTFDSDMRVSISAYPQGNTKYSNDVGRVIFNNCFGGRFWIADQTESEIVTGSVIKSITVNNWLNCTRFFMEYGTIESLKINGLRFDQGISYGDMRNRRIEIGANCTVLSMVNSEDTEYAYEELAQKGSAIQADEIATTDMKIRAAENTRITALTVYGKADEALGSDTIVFDGDNLIPGLNGFSIEIKDINLNGDGSVLHFKNFKIPQKWRNRTFIASAMIDATNANAEQNNVCLWFYDYDGNTILKSNGYYERDTIIFLSEAKVTIPDDAYKMTIGARLYAYESGVTGKSARAYDFKFFARDELKVSGDFLLLNIPVGSDGNYADAAGQQYLCNYIDCGMGLQYRYVEYLYNQSIKAEWLTDMGDYFAENIVGGFIPREIVEAGNKVGRKLDRYSSALPILNTATPPVDAESIWVSDGGIGFAVSVETAGARTMDALAAYIQSIQEPILCEMNSVQMTEISKTLTTQYNAIRLYGGKTRVYSKNGGYFKLGYYRDTKDYIDERIEAAAPGKYELIQDLTLTEEQTTISFDYLNLKKLVIFSYVKFVEGQGVYGATHINGTIRDLAFGDSCNSTNFTRGFLSLDCSEGLLMSQSSANVGNNYSFGISKQPFRSAYEPILLECIKSLTIGSWTSYKFAPESRFIIYGVKRKEGMV